MQDVPNTDSLLQINTLFKNVEVRDIASKIYSQVNLTAIDISETNPFVSLPKTASLYDVITVMQEKRIRRVPITDGDKLVNYISEFLIVDFIYKHSKDQWVYCQYNTHLLIARS